MLRHKSGILVVYQIVKPRAVVHVVAIEDEAVAVGVGFAAVIQKDRAVAVLPAVKIVAEVIVVVPLDHRGGKPLFSPQLQPAHQVRVDGGQGGQARVQGGEVLRAGAAVGLGLVVNAVQLLLLAADVPGLGADIDGVAAKEAGEGDGNRHQAGQAGAEQSTEQVHGGGLLFDKLLPWGELETASTMIPENFE